MTKLVNKASGYIDVKWLVTTVIAIVIFVVPITLSRGELSVEVKVNTEARHSQAQINEKLLDRLNRMDNTLTKLNTTMEIMNTNGVRIKE